MKRRTIAILRTATAADRDGIYALRHEVYAGELQQHRPNDQGRLCDAIDEANVYIVAECAGQLAGFISVTPPEAPVFSLEKYPAFDARALGRSADVFEVRLLTVRRAFRGTLVAGALMFAALRYVEAHGGKHIVGMGRQAVLGVYRKVGLETTGPTVQSGAVHFDLMRTPVERLRRQLRPSWLARIERHVEWRLPFPVSPYASCFHGGASIDAIGETFDRLSHRDEIINADVLDAWYPPSPRVVTALQDHLSWLTRTSPPAGCAGMLRTIARVRGVDERCLVPGGGSSALIFLALRHWLTRASRVLLVDPTYGEYAHVLERVIGCQVERFHLRRDEQYDLNPGAFARAMSRNFDLVVLVNPNSPTGRHVAAAELRSVLSQAPDTTRIWVDETYVDYVGASESLEPFAASSTNVVVCKSMSKVYALSGLRAAYLCGPHDLMAELRGITPPWAVSLPAQVAAVRALDDPEYYAQQYRETHHQRRQLTGALSALGFDVVSGTANFILAHVAEGRMTAAELRERCRTRHLFLRDVTDMGVRAAAVRIAVKDGATNQRIVRIVADALHESAASGPPEGGHYVCLVRLKTDATALVRLKTDATPAA